MRKKISADNEAFQRIFEAANCKTQLQLANFLGIHQSSISESIRKKTIPAEWLLQLVIGKNINPAWILSGEEAQFLYASDEVQQHLIVQNLSNCRKLEEYSNEELLQTLSKRMGKNVEISLTYKPE